MAHLSAIWQCLHGVHECSLGIEAAHFPEVPYFAACHQERGQETQLPTQMHVMPSTCACSTRSCSMAAPSGLWCISTICAIVMWLCVEDADNRGWECKAAPDRQCESPQRYNGAAARSAHGAAGGGCISSNCWTHPKYAASFLRHEEP